MGNTDRGQAYTLEGVISAIVIASALVLGVQAVNITPFTDDGPEAGTDLRTQVHDALEIAQDRGGLKTAVTCLGSDTTTPPQGVISPGDEITSFGAVLNNTLRNVVGSSYNVYVDYPNENGNIEQLVIGSKGNVTGSSVTVTKQITLFNSDPVYELDANREDCVRVGTIGEINENDIYLSNQSPGDELYAVIQVRVVAWQA
jgi:hypothetical protein